MTPTTATNTSIPFFSVLELHARADVFRRTYRGSGKLHCRVDQSLAISKFHAVDALAYIHQARALIDHLNIDELGIALNRVLQETEDDVALGKFFSSLAVYSELDSILTCLPLAGLDL